ncbi:transcriptional regulator [Enterobacter sp. A11]|nr:transcriptional regulator [Enterobacter sp. A11]
MPPYNVFDERCPTRDVLARIADKWALLILARLENGPMRFNKLQRDIQRITKKVLTQALRKLERDGLVSREVFATVPVTVEYSLTPLGQALTETVTVLAHWVESNMDAIVAAQSAYDAANAQT